MKRRVYIETSVISYLTSRPSRDVVAAARQEQTLEWWDDVAGSYSLYVSDVVLDEAALGDPGAAQRRIVAMNNIPILALSDTARTVAGQLLQSGIIPSHVAADAFHVAIAATNGIDYLITWNCKHLANASIRRRLEAEVEELGYSCPVICTPEELKVI